METFAQLGAVGILCLTIYIMARMITPLVKENIAARREIAAQAEKNAAMNKRTADTMEAVADGLRQLVDDHRARAERDRAADATLAGLPEAIERRVTAPDSALVLLHQARTDAAVKQVEKTVNEGIERIEATVKDAIEAVQKHQPYTAIMDKLKDIHEAVKQIQPPAPVEAAPDTTAETPTENKGDEA